MSLPRYPEYKDSGVEWLGDVPSAWKVDRLKASITSCKNGIWGDEPKGDESDIDCVRVADFDRARLVVDGPVPTRRSVTASECAGRILRRGDLLLEKSGGGEKQPVGQVVLYDRDEPAVCSNFVARVSLAEGMVPRFWMYQHAAAYSRGVNIVAIKQTSGIQNLDQSQYFEERGVFPSRAEQEQVAIFLDRETARIDALIAEQEKLLALLAEKRQATISHAVTRGLDPNVPMKDSGIAWLGEVPAHWRMLRIKALSHFTTSGPRGWSERIREDGSLFIQSGDLNESLGLELETAKRVDVGDDAEATRTRLVEGDVVVCITGAKTGNVALCPPLDEPAYVNQHLCLIRSIEDVDGSFLALALKSDIGRTQFDLAQYGLKQGLSLENVRDLWIGIPPCEEQQAILDLVEGTMRNLTSLAQIAAAGVSLLKERRSALITAAVTGQIDVSGLVEAEAADACR